MYLYVIIYIINKLKQNDLSMYPFRSCGRRSALIIKLNIYKTNKY